MYALKPFAIGSDQLVSSSADATTATEWIAGQLWDEDDLAWEYVGGIQFEYLRHVGGVDIDDQSPSENVAAGSGGEGTFWRLVGPSNQYAMFDSQPATQTIAPSPLVVTVGDVGPARAVAFIALSGGSLNVTVMDGVTEVYNRTVSLDLNQPYNYYDYFLVPFEQRTKVVLTDLPDISNPQITMTLSRPDSDVAVGVMTAGVLRFLGDVQWGVTLNFLDYSRKQTDDITGAVSLEQRGFRSAVNASAWVDEADFSRIHRRIAELRGLTCLFITAPDNEAYEALTVFGFVKAFSMVAPHPTKSLVNLEIEGMLAA